MMTKTNIDAYTAARDAMGYNRNDAEVAARAMLEAIVDRFHFADTLELLAAVASDKADRLACNWQDNDNARDFAKLAETLTKLSEKTWF